VIEEDDIVSLLRGETTVDALVSRLGFSRRQVSDRRRRYLRSKLPKSDGDTRTDGLDGPVEILRDRWGVAHIEANCIADGFFGLGYAMAQDRLWQLDHMRRLACGRLAEVLGADFVDQDRLHRTIGLKQSADEAYAVADDEVRLVLTSLSSGINAHIQACKNLPVEFDVLDYTPEAWTPEDSIAVWKWRWWMLTGRLNILAVAEAGKRHLDPERFDLFMSCEANDQTIVPGDGPAVSGGHDTGMGSNNWVVGGSLTTSGKPILATDPHNSVDLSRQWYQAQLTIPGLDAVGAFFLGTPGIYLGHTRHTAWGVTNHTASARDVYVEQPGAAEDTYQEGEGQVAFEKRVETIKVKGSPDVTCVVRTTARGPLVQAFVPRIDEVDRLLSLKWEGSVSTTGFESMLGLLRSTSIDEVVDALEQWPFPILNFVFADDNGRIGYHVAGKVPERRSPDPGFRNPNDPDDAWSSHYAFDSLPHMADPDRDWVATANNPPWAGDEPYSRHGSWADGYRFRRIRTRIEASREHDIRSVGAIQADTVLGRAEDLAQTVASYAERGPNKAIRDLADHLKDWDGAYDVDLVAPTVFSAFWNQWLIQVARSRFPDALVDLVKDRCGGVANLVLSGAQVAWFPEGTVIETEVMAALKRTVVWLREHVGSRQSGWRWGKLHTVTFDHPAASAPELRKLLCVGPSETSGVTGSVRAAGHSLVEPFKVTGLSTYRMVVDMSKPSRALATAAGGQSGHPASPHYRTQTRLWLDDDYHPLLMDRADIERELDGRLVLHP